MNLKEINKTRINNIINIILNPTRDIINRIPKSLSEPPVFTTSLLTESFYILAFLDKENSRKIKRYIDQGYLFPFLIKPENIDAMCFVSMDHAQYGIVDNTKFVNGYSFSLGKDSTLILQNHTVSVTSNELQKVEYSID